MDPQATGMVELLEKTLQALGDQMGVAMPHVIEMLIKQQYVEAYQGIIGIVVFGAILAGLFFGLLWATKKQVSYGMELWMVLLFAVAVYVVVAVGISGDIIGKLVNPEYYAVRSVFRLFLTGGK